jgi:hypothetical protein
MAEVLPLRADAFPEVHRTLLTRLNPGIPPEIWRRLFHPPWRAPDPTVGYGLYDEGRGFVGFLGTLRVELPRDGRTMSLCNLTSWIVLPEFRRQSLALVAPELARRGVTLTNLTAVPQVHEVMLRLGFRVLDAHRTVFTAPVRSGERVELVWDVDALPAILPASDLRVMEDHLPAGRHLAAVHPTMGVCYLLYDVVRHLHLPCARLYHIGDAAIFRRVRPAVHHHLLRRHGAVFLDFDSRLGGPEPFPGGRRVPMPVPRLYRSADLAPAEVPCTHSELPLLRL